MKKIKAYFFRLCPKTGRIIGLKPLNLYAPWFIPFFGLAALIWVIIRVGPKPSRAQYPCQRIAIPLAESFVVWLFGLLAAALSLRKLYQWLIHKQYLKVSFTMLLVATFLGGAFSIGKSVDLADYTPHPANDPIGVAQGLAPGRVVWVHNPDVTDWAGPSSMELWYEHIDQSAATEMMSWALESYSDETTISGSWDFIFSHFNGGNSYLPGEKIYIKINLTTVNAGGGFADANYDPVFMGSVTRGSTANSPQLLLALLDQLITDLGVAQSDITIGDLTGLFVNYLYNPLNDQFPDVNYEDNRGTLGRSKATYTSPCVPYYWSTSDADGKTQDCVLQSYYDADYLINFSVLKSHERAGMTVAAKNHYGSMLRTPTASGYYDLHQRLPLEDYNTDYRNMGYYRPQVDLMGNEYIGGKTVLYIIDGIYGGEGWASNPSTWSITPFNDDWPSSIFVSMDPVAIDSVAFDFLSQQWPEQVLKYEGVQDFLHEAALADNPGSGTCYDPEHDGTCMTSLGVHEHWNNAIDKQYSRNLNTGEGIELLYITSDPISTTYDLSLTVSPEQGGSTVPAVGTHSYDSGTFVEVTTEPNTGYDFDHWGGDCTGSEACNLTMDENKNVTAYFSEITLLGDVNGDDLVNSTDALIVLKGDVGLNISPYCPMNCGDANGDGFVNSTDALIILKYDVGLSVSFPLGQSGCPASIAQPPGCTP